MQRTLFDRTTSFVRGMDDSSAPTAYPEGAVALLENCHVLPNGVARRRRGTKRTSDAVNGDVQCFGLAVFTPTGADEQWVGFFGAKAFVSTDLGANWTEIADSLEEDYWCFATFEMAGDAYLLCVNGDAAYSWDGTTWAEESDIPTGARYIATWNDRVVIAGHDGRRVQASRIGDFQTWTSPDGWTVPVQTHDGHGAITGLWVLGDWLIVFQRYGTAIVDGFGQSDLVVEAGARGLSRSIGCIAPRSIAGVGQGVMWLSDRGFEYLPGPGAGIHLVSKPVERFIRELEWTGLATSPFVPCAIYVPGLREYWCALPTGGSQNTVTFVWREPVPEMDAPPAISLFTYTGEGSYSLYGEDTYLHFEASTNRARARQEDTYMTLSLTSGVFVGLDADGYIQTAGADHTAAAFALAETSDGALPIAGCYDGHVQVMETGGMDDMLPDGTGGHPIVARIVSRPFHLGDPFTRKRWTRLEVLAVAPNGGSMDVRLLADGVPGDTHTTTAPATADEPRLVRARVRGRARLGAGEMTTTDDISFAGVALGGAPLELL